MMDLRFLFKWWIFCFSMVFAPVFESWVSTRVSNSLMFVGGHRPAVCGCQNVIDDEDSSMYKSGFQLFYTDVLFMAIRG